MALIVSLRGDLHRFSGKADMKVTTLHPATVTDVWRKRICFNGPLPPDGSVARYGRPPQLPARPGGGRALRGAGGP